MDCSIEQILAFILSGGLTIREYTNKSGRKINLVYLNAITAETKGLCRSTARTLTQHALSVNDFFHIVHAPCCSHAARNMFSLATKKRERAKNVRYEKAFKPFSFLLRAHLANKLSHTDTSLVRLPFLFSVANKAIKRPNKTCVQVE